MQRTDFYVSITGDIVRVRPNSERARDWHDEHLAGLSQVDRPTLSRLLSKLNGTGAVVRTNLAPAEVL